jgi:hypothetical protein
MSNRNLKRSVVVAVLASITLTPGLTQVGIIPADTDMSTIMFGKPFIIPNAGTFPLTDIPPSMISSLLEGPPTAEAPTIQNAPVTQNFIQLAQPEEPTNYDTTYAAPAYSGTDLQGDLGDSDVSEDSY